MEPVQNEKVRLEIWLDSRVNVWHLGLYMVFLYLWNQNNRQNPITISRRRVMKLARFKSTATYHKCIKELIAFGYIDYDPTYNYYRGTKVFLKRR
ncbi:hypothetical protein GCM10023091_00690 [Ravibacter arvi]|uniref:Transcriptional regulator n=1 Tax=Ravibacter arvi TaxID=2051041 RepID=A0ABP8LJL0_9BACT